MNKNNSTPKLLTSNDNSFKISIPGQIKFERKDTATLDIFSEKDEMILYETGNTVHVLFFQFLNGSFLL